MEDLKKALAKIAPFILCWVMVLVTYFMAKNTEKGFDVLVAVVGLFQ